MTVGFRQNHLHSGGLRASAQLGGDVFLKSRIHGPRHNKSRPFPYHHFFIEATVAYPCRSPTPSSRIHVQVWRMENKNSTKRCSGLDF